MSCEIQVCKNLPQIKQRPFLADGGGGLLVLIEKFKAAVYRIWSDQVTLDLCLSGSHVFGMMYKTQSAAL